MSNLFEVKMTREEIIDGLRSQYGSEFTTPEVRAFCAMNDITYQTVTKKLKEFKVRTKLNLFLKYFIGPGWIPFQNVCTKYVDCHQH